MMIVMISTMMVIQWLKSYLPSLNLSRVEAFTPRKEVSVPVFIIVMLVVIIAMIMVSIVIRMKLK